jgi:hypothetical protein
MVRFAFAASIVLTFLDVKFFVCLFDGELTSGDVKSIWPKSNEPNPRELPAS